MKMDVTLKVLLSFMLCYGCFVSPLSADPLSQKDARIEEIINYEFAIKLVILECTSTLRIALNHHPGQVQNAKVCNDELDEIVVLSKKNADGIIKYKKEFEEYQALYSAVFSQIEIFEKSDLLMRSIRKYKGDLDVQIGELNNIFLSSTGENTKDLIYVNERNGMLLDRAVLNAELAINPGTKNDQRIHYFDRMARDASIVGKVMQAMLKGDGRLGIKKATQSQAKNHLIKSQDLYDKFEINVGELLDMAPSIVEARNLLSSLEALTNKIDSL